MGRTAWQEPDRTFIDTILVPAWRQMLDQDLQLLRLAYDLSKYAHSLDTPPRKSTGEPYYMHPMEVARILLEEVPFMDEQLIFIAFLHDVLEDTGLLSVHHLHLVFGRDVAQAVKVLSKNDFEEQVRQQFITREEADSLYFGRIAMADTWRATVVKLADRLHNLRTTDGLRASSKRRLVATTEQHVLPLVRVAVKQAPKLKRPRVRQLGKLLEQELSELR